MNRLNLGEVAAARVIGVSQSTIHRIVVDGSTPRCDTIAKFKAAIGVSEAAWFAP